MRKILKFLKEEDGITAIEYALIAGLMGLAVFAAWTTLKGKFNGTLTNVGAKLDSAGH